MPCDSLFIDFLGVNHCISFDTVKVILDSNYSVQILHDAQQFYADSFGDLLMAFTIFIALSSSNRFILKLRKYGQCPLSVKTILGECL